MSKNSFQRFADGAVAKAALLGFCLIMPAACETVTSANRAELSAAPESSGLTYYLPIRFAHLDVTKKTVDAEQLQTKIKAQKDKLSTAIADASLKTKAIKDLKARIGALPDASSIEARSELVRDLSLAQADLQILTGAATALLVDIAKLESTLLELRSSSKGCAHDLKITILDPVGDVSAAYTANGAHNWFRDDTVKLSVTSSGLLSNADVIAVDQTSSVLTSLAGLSGISGGPKTLGFDGGNDLIESGQECEDVRPLQLMFDPANPETINQVNASLENAGLVYKLQTTATTKPKKTAICPPESKSDYCKSTDKAGGLFYRTPAPVALSVLDCRATNGTIDSKKCRSVSVTQLMLPQAGPVGFVSFNSSAFVTVKSDAKFENGTMVSFNSSRPSEVVEAASLPLDILKAAVSVPTEILKLRIDYDSQAEKAVESAASLEEENLQNTARELCLEAAEDDIEAQLACFTS